MKKLFPIFLSLIFLVACAGDNLEQQQIQQDIASDNTSNNDTEDINNTDDSGDNQNQEVSTNENTVDMLAIEHFIEDMYVLDNIEDYRNTEVVSTEFSNRMESQSAEYEQEELPDIENSISNVDLYESMSSRTDELIYILELEVINHDLENIEKSERVGKVSLTEEDGTFKINNITEMYNKEVFED